VPRTISQAFIVIITTIIIVQEEFVQIVVNSHGPINTDAFQFLRKLGIQAIGGDDWGSSKNSGLLHDGFTDDDRLE